MSKGHFVLDKLDQVSSLEQEKRDELKNRKPRVYEKIRNFDARAHLGFISPIIRVCWDYTCNFVCDHCCAEERMPRTIRKLVAKNGKADNRYTMSYDDLAKFASDADEYGLYRMVLTGGEPTMWKDLFKVIEILDPNRHLVIMDSNALRIADEEQFSVRALADAGVYKLQISLDSFVEAEHDTFRKMPGSYQRVRKVLPQVIPAGMKLLVSTCLTAGRASTQEFADLNRYCTEEIGAMLYVTYAKPTGSCASHMDWMVTKADTDKIREFEAKGFNITTHMTPSYMRQKDAGSVPLGHYDGCITVKGINNLEPWGDIVPCPYMDVAIGNVLQDPIATILDRGMRIKDLGPQRNDCLIGEDPEFMGRHNTAVARWKIQGNQVPLPWGEFWTDKDVVL